MKGFGEVVITRGTQLELLHQHNILNPPIPHLLAFEDAGVGLAWFFFVSACELVGEGLSEVAFLSILNNHDTSVGVQEPLVVLPSDHRTLGGHPPPPTHKQPPRKNAENKRRPNLGIYAWHVIRSEVKLMFNFTRVISQHKK